MVMFHKLAIVYQSVTRMNQGFMVSTFVENRHLQSPRDYKDSFVGVLHRRLLRVTCPPISMDVGNAPNVTVAQKEVSN